MLSRGLKRVVLGKYFSFAAGENTETSASIMKRFDCCVFCVFKLFFLHWELLDLVTQDLTHAASCSRCVPVAKKQVSILFGKAT